MCWDTLEVVVPSSSATSLIDPRRESSRRMRRRWVCTRAVFMIVERCVQQSRVDVHGLVGFTGWHGRPDDSQHMQGRRSRTLRRPDGCRARARVDDLRPAGTRGLRGPHRRPGHAGDRVAATRVGGRADAGDRPAPVVAVLRSGAARRHRPRCGHCGRHDAVHGRHRAAAARHGQRAGVPRATGRRRLARPRTCPGLGRAGGDRRTAPDPALDRRGRRTRCGLRARCCRVLGGLHPAHPASGRRGLGPRGAGDLDAGRRGGGDARRRARGVLAADPRAARGRPGAGDPPAGGALRLRAARPAAADDRGVRHPDEPGAGHRDGHRLRGPRPGARCRRGRRHRVRRARRASEPSARARGHRRLRSRRRRPGWSPRSEVARVTGPCPACWVPCVSPSTS